MQSSTEPEEKIEKETTRAPTSLEIVSDEQPVIDWTESEETKVRWKLDLLMMPLLLAGFFVLQLDRSNIANALTSSIVKDLNLASSNVVSSGNQIQTAAIIAFEIPSNILLQKVGAPIWITFEIMVWGMVALFQAFMTNKSSYYATRFLLGLFESGFVPACQFMMGVFYKRDELAIRTAIFYIGNYFATGTGSLMAAGIFKLSGKYNLAGWQWLFIIDGCFTVAIGFFYLFLLPSTPSHTKPLCGMLDLFSDRERHILHNRVIIDDPKKDTPLSRISVQDVLRALSNPNLWGHLSINILALVPAGGLRLFSPSIIKALGFGTTKANALNSISSYGVIVLAVSMSYISDRTRRRGLWIAIPISYSMIFAGTLYGLPQHTAKWTRFAIFTLLTAGNSVSQGINDSWMSINARTPQERSIGLAMAVMGANIGGLAGQSLFQTSDAPRYNQSFLAILCLYSASLVFVLAQIWSYWFQNKNLATGEESRRESPMELEGRLGWRYEI
ncbi:hypothetical protein BP6252_01878 [Coleophoma cylindrospora]|uniref:Major facilitator superfamily (MFS) profile domain-containing protein n=1 Tax=Coleophoma cylindrospora TaxID=1849047 RepID=A0A3D8SEV6_9HELO|nr:hypothetical protein BP6252_01878 [Coleophoma cylindrospora]